MIDVHTHLFNARYVPIEGILLSRIRSHNRFLDVPLRLLRLLLRVSAYKVGGMIRWATRLDDPAAMPGPVDCGRVDLPLESLTFHTTEEADLPDIATSARVGSGGAVRTLGFPQRKAPHFGHHFRHWAERPSDEALELGESLDKVLKATRSSGLLTWLLALLGRESRLAQHLYCIWGDHIDHFVVHMMDLGPHYEGSTMRYEEQVARTEALLSAFPKFIGFVAWSPQRANSLDIIQDAIKNRGFKGVKFYPPSGYRPTSNQRVPGGNAGDIDKANDGLFKWCASEGVPLFAHCAPGDMEYARGAGAYLSHPKYWQQVLKRHGTLRLCLGHAGGEVAWFGPDDEQYADWRKPVVELCLKHDGVFCEFGPLDGDYKPKWIDRFKNRLSSLAANPATVPFMNKICFGSDYHLLLRHDNSGEYSTFFQQIFQDPRLACFADRFFDRNARMWLGLQDPVPGRACPLSTPLVVSSDSARASGRG